MLEFKKRPPKYCVAIATLALFFLSLNSGAVEAKNSNKKSSRANLRNTIALGSFIATGSAQVNYERLIGDKHGLLLEGYYSFDGLSKDTTTVGISYRYHYQTSLEGWFSNVFFRTGNVKFKTDIKENNVSNTYLLKTHLNLIGLGAGYRWIVMDNLALVARGGYGYQLAAKYDWSPNTPTNSHKKNTAEKLQGMDLELSIGYAF